MTDAASERATYDRIADAVGEALRTLAHDAANCAAVFDMEVSELGGADATGAGDSLRAATERLRRHVQDLRAFAAAKRFDGTALGEALALSLRLMSRSAKRDLSRVPGERVECRIRAAQLPVLLGLLVTLRTIVRLTDGAGLTRASSAPDAGDGTISLVLAMPPEAFDEVATVARGALAELASVNAGVHADGSGHTLTLRFPT